MRKVVLPIDRRCVCETHEKLYRREGYEYSESEKCKCNAKEVIRYFKREQK